MIHHLEIENFKSIKHLKIQCKKRNIFIGEPNTGKSNILESIGIFSLPYGDLSDFVRFETMSNLFYDQNLEDTIKIRTDKETVEIAFKDLKFKGKYCGERGEFTFEYDYQGKGSASCSPESPYKFYRFTMREDFPTPKPGLLLPPSGANLLTVLMTNKHLKSVINQIFIPFGLRLVFKPQENKIDVFKQQNDIVISYPYAVVSETLQRVVFYLTAIKSNKDAVLIFEEPESHAFPYYTKFLAETIALDENNQYFISTHNPYFLLSVLEKSPKDEIGVFITYFEDYQTRVNLLSDKELQKVMDEGVDLFFNSEHFIEGKE